MINKCRFVGALCVCSPTFISLVELYYHATKRTVHSLDSSSYLISIYFVYIYIYIFIARVGSVWFSDRLYSPIYILRRIYEVYSGVLLTPTDVCFRLLSRNINKLVDPSGVGFKNTDLHFQKLFIVNVGPLEPPGSLCIPRQFCPVACAS